MTLLNKSLNLRNKNCVGGKYNKLCLTGVAASNAIGENLPIFVIGASKSPHFFKEVKHLPCRHRNQKKSWTDRLLYEKWIREIDRRFTA